MRIGAHYSGNGQCQWCVWAPQRDSVALKIISPSERIIPMEKDDRGYWHAQSGGISPESTYVYVLDGRIDRPDPVSSFQPEGVHNPSGIIDHNSFSWNDQGWEGIAVSEMIIYELHVGTFTPEGTFGAILGKFDHFKQLGINTIEIMPVSQFPGERNWGYDGVYPFSVQNSYGGPENLKKFIDKAHCAGFAVILDVVYNHLGPEGNYLSDFGPYFTDRYRTPWGKAVNFDSAMSDKVRDYFIENALYWFKYYHIDVLRLDAIHGIYDFGAKHILEEMAERVEEFSRKQKRKCYLIAESDLNDVRVVREKEKGGYAIDAQWLDDFHHSLRTLLTKESAGYYADFGRLEQLEKCEREGFVYSWDYSCCRKKYFGSSSRDIAPDKFIVFIQNHDQVGNRIEGKRIGHLVDFEALKLAAGCMILSPYIPMLFMGEEFASSSPFLYFISHLDTQLVEAVRTGRKKEFASFGWQAEPPDPQSEATFNLSKLKWEEVARGQHAVMFSFYQELIRLRKTVAAFAESSREGIKTCCASPEVMALIRNSKSSETITLMNFSSNEEVYPCDNVTGRMTCILDSSHQKWQGPGSVSPETVESGGNVTMNPLSLVVYKTEVSK
ncbi:MAG: malto-oligosyltrehalose trehalohydrolase [Candidatus Omnitrophica bacterium]|nr:malto-oligosyltrehalose trehalohydrolase [Candidatus Omnitrophota bacterium]